MAAHSTLPLPVQVYAIDLLGFGRSDKPLLDYSTELWRDQLMDFMSEFVDAPAVLVGNSIGSLVSLMVSRAHLHTCRAVLTCMVRTSALAFAHLTHSAGQRQVIRRCCARHCPPELCGRHEHKGASAGFCLSERA